MISSCGFRIRDETLVLRVQEQLIVVKSEFNGEENWEIISFFVVLEINSPFCRNREVLYEFCWRFGMQPVRKKKDRRNVESHLSVCRHECGGRYFFFLFLTDVPFSCWFDLIRLESGSFWGKGWVWSQQLPTLLVNKDEGDGRTHQRRVFHIWV